VVALALSTSAGASAKLQVIYNLLGGSGDGANPIGPLLMDGSGSLYGVTLSGGSANAGTVFKISPRGQETVLHVFTGTGGEGSHPFGGVLVDALGNLYGTTSGGGTNGLGIVFKLAPSGVETILHTFQGICCGGGDGSFPYSSLIIDEHGNMFGTTMNGGNSSDLGTVFRVTPDGTENVIHAFSGTDGSEPFFGNLAIGKHGTVYGAALFGGEYNAGVAFRMTAHGTETMLHQFGAGADGQNPEGWIAVDNGNIYGTTQQGGGSANAGIVYKIDNSGVETILHVFNGADGATPLAVTLVGKALYGVTAGGGANNSGTLFKLSLNGRFTTLHAFDGTDGDGPNAPLIAGSDGNLYGSTYRGGAQGNGVVFKLTLKQRKAG
jgi:uncharacterized repeat protein (TIGR03803 family)